MQPNAAIANVVLHDLDLHFQGQAVSYYELAIKNAQSADVPGRSASTRTPPPRRRGVALAWICFLTNRCVRVYQSLFLII